MTLFHWMVLFLVLLPLVLLMLHQKPPLMTVVAARNQDKLTHQECNGGAVTLTTDQAAWKNTVTCAGCKAKAEFAPIYAHLFRFAQEDGKPRDITISRYRDAPIKGRLHIIPAPPAP